MSPRQPLRNIDINHSSPRHTEITGYLRIPHRTHPSLPLPSHEIPLRPLFKSPFSSGSDAEPANAMSHQHKRPYAGSQPSITSYFAPAISPTNTEPHIYSISPQARPENCSPHLPATVQSNLLSVGMRVRKSVPEGYKTGSYSAFTLFSDNSSARASMAGEQRAETRADNVTTRTRPRARELTPFCGLHSIGGLVAAGDGKSFVSIEEMDEDDDVPALSQSSTVSNDSISAPGDRKRRLDFDEEDSNEFQLEAMRDRTMSFGLGGRAIAVPRKKKNVKVADVRVLGQENIDDFEDAEFLDYDLIGTAGEVEMGGL